jgi:hypothetical protein
LGEKRLGGGVEVCQRRERWPISLLALHGVKGNTLCQKVFRQGLLFDWLATVFFFSIGAFNDKNLHLCLAQLW